MPQKATKFQQIMPVSLQFTGGLNYAQSPTHIADNELVRAINIIYNSQTGIPETRAGTTCVTAAALAHPITKLYYYEKSSSQKWLVCASYGKLYKLSADAWVEIGNLTNTTTVPSFLTFNTKLIIADGGTNLRTWDGTTYSTLSDGLTADAVTEIGGRVVINSTVDPDLVTFSGAEDQTMWNTADLTNPAIGLRAGFGDNLTVNGFSVFGKDLLVSKRGSAIKCIYRINTTDPQPVNWTVSKLTANNCTQNAHTFVSAFNNTFFVDTDGFKSIRGVTEYGDLQVDDTGSKINTRFAGDTCSEAVYLPAYSAIWYLVSDRVYCYHRTPGTNNPAFTEVLFGQGKINSAVQAGTTIYLAGDNGYLYQLSSAESTDETAPNVTVGFPTVMISKRFNFGEGGVLRRTILDLKALSTPENTSAYLRVKTESQGNILLKTFAVLTEALEIYDATGEISVATTYLGNASSAAWSERSTNHVRSTSMQFQIDSTSGRFGLEGLTAELAMVGS